MHKLSLTNPSAFSEAAKGKLHANSRLFAFLRLTVNNRTKLLFSSEKFPSPWNLTVYFASYLSLRSMLDYFYTHSNSPKKGLYQAKAFGLPLIGEGYGSMYENHSIALILGPLTFKLNCLQQTRFFQDGSASILRTECQSRAGIIWQFRPTQEVK